MMSTVGSHSSHAGWSGVAAWTRSIRLFVAMVPLCGALSGVVRAEQAVSFARTDSRLEVRVDGKPLATYVWNDPAIRRPYFAALRAPGGAQVTRRHPPVDGQDATDHATMHPGLWLAFGDISGSDFWRNKGEVRHVEFVESPAAGGARGAFAVRNQYLAGEKLLCEEVCRIEFEARPAGTLLTWESVFRGKEPFAFGDQEEMGLGIRVATPLAVKNGGRIVNNDGLVNEKQVWGKTAEWCDYSGTIDGQAVGLLLMPDPANFRPAWFHARDYGLLVANPFGRKAFTKGDPSRVVVNPGEPFRLRFGLYVHQGETDRAAIYRAWLSSLEGK